MDGFWDRTEDIWHIKLLHRNWLAKELNGAESQVGLLLLDLGTGIEESVGWSWRLLAQV